MSPAEILRAISELDERASRVLSLALDDGAHELHECTLATAVRLNYPLGELAAAGLEHANTYEELVLA